jgi:hypothetical protein
MAGNSCFGNAIPDLGKVAKKKFRDKNDPELPNLTAYEDYNILQHYFLR